MPESLQKVEGMTVSQIQEALGISRRKAHEIQKKQKQE
jgi:DNA-binding transcriptional regulator LsrR (DeoR family)